MHQTIDGRVGPWLSKATIKTRKCGDSEACIGGVSMAHRCRMRELIGSFHPGWCDQQKWPAVSGAGAPVLGGGKPTFIGVSIGPLDAACQDCE